jgi:hypothetical protein
MGARVGARARFGLLWAAALLVALPAALAQDKQLSDESVSTLMQYAWAITPGKFTTPGGKVIEVDKTKYKDIEIPIDTARDVIRVGRLSAHAQICDLPDEQAANFRTFMLREEAKGKWTDQQLLYINQLHLFTVLTLTGQVKLTEVEGEKQAPGKGPQKAPEKAPPQKAPQTDSAPAKAQTCTDADRKKVSAQILAYINTPAAPAGKAAPAAKGPAPGSGAEKK